MLKRRVATGILLTLAVAGLAGCRTSPSVAAYVGDATVTVSELEAAVADRMADPRIAAFAEGQEDEFTRQVLSLLVQEEIYAAAAERYDVRIGDAAVRERIEELLGGQDADATFAGLADRGIGRADILENVRQQMVRQEIAVVEGKADEAGEDELRARYDEVRDSLGQVSFGYITVPDQPTADAVLAQLTAAPASYPAVAAQYPGTYTLTALEERQPEQLPSALSEGITAAAPNTGFTLAVPETGGVVVTFVAGMVYPTFEELRSQLEGEASEQADQAGGELVDAVREDLDVTVNPRFGVLDGANLVPAGEGVVDILEEEGSGS